MKPVLDLPPDPLLDEEIRAELARDLIEQGRVSLPLVLVLLFVMAQMLGQALFSNRTALMWYGFLLAVVVLRWGHTHLALHGPWPLSSPRVRMWSFACGALMMGLGLAVVSVLVYPSLSPVQIALLALVHLAVLSVGILAMAASPTAFLAFMLPVLGALTYLLAWDRGHWGAWNLLLLVASFTSGLGFLILRQFRLRREALALSFQNSRAALQDSLTGLRNRRFLQAFMETEASQILRDPEGGALALLMIDLDQFKSVNDTFGHAAGDTVLSHCAALLRDTARKSDVLARWGGEEFVVVARLQEGESIAPLADRFLQRLRAEPMRLADGRDLPQTCSIGYARYPFFSERPELLNWERVLALADTAMLRAKAAGRDRLAGAVAGDVRPASPAHVLERLRDLPKAEKDGLLRITVWT
ncbi:MAG TPA: GGDEF domain-containing protein [Holophagaceae bacterium]|nr:GGDEF domain-containing protein [Holophagaceae bacterium]